MSARNPKDLKTMIAASQEDTTNMKANLSKLKSLKEDDKTENALLRSRIDEQSQLIMMLKQRTDESIVKIQTLTRINDELQKFREEANSKLENEIRRFNLLEKHFEELAYNHEEIIKFKDEYKRQNEELREENKKLKADNERLFSKAIEQKDEQIKELQKTLGSYKEQQVNHVKKIQQLEDKHAEMYKKLTTENLTYQTRISTTEQALKDLTEKLKMKEQLLSNQDQALSSKLQQISKDKDELLELSMQRGRTIQDKQREIKELQKKLESSQQDLRVVEQKFKDDCALVSSNVQVRRLNVQLEAALDREQQLRQDYEAYKKHTGQLLQKERALNEKLSLLT